MTNCNDTQLLKSAQIIEKEWESLDNQLYIKILTNTHIMVETGRISFMAPITSFTASELVTDGSDVDSSFYLCCAGVTVSIELASYDELLQVSRFLGIDIIKE